MTDFFNLPSKVGQDTQNQYLSQIAQHLGVTAGNLQDAINMANQANQAAAEKITDLETRFQTLTAEQQQDAEVIDARDGETSLRARLDRDHAEFESHMADNVTDSDGAHGLKVERGTFTPTIIGLTTTGNNTYSTNSGFYEKIGRTVIFHIFIVMTAKDPAMEGSVHIAGLPFVAYAQSNRHNSVSIASYSNIVTAGKQLGGYIQDSRATIGILLSGDNIGASNLSALGINNNTMIRLSGMYQTS